jgi:hypothetical protein
MGGFYSFRVFAPHEVVIIENFVALDAGMNTFNVHVNCIDSFVAKLKAEDVRIDQMNSLDPEPEPTAERLLSE